MRASRNSPGALGRRRYRRDAAPAARYAPGRPRARDAANPPEALTVLLNDTIDRLLAAELGSVRVAIAGVLASGRMSAWRTVPAPPPLAGLRVRLLDGVLDMELQWADATLVSDGARLVVVVDGELPATILAGVIGRRLAEVVGADALRAANDPPLVHRAEAPDGGGLTFLTIEGRLTSAEF